MLFCIERKLVLVISVHADDCLALGEIVYHRPLGMARWIAWSFCLTHTIEQIHGSFLRQLVAVLFQNEFHHVVAGLAVVREFRTFI